MDNSSWIRSGKFRLGARLVDDIDEVRVREARSEPFRVKNLPRDSCVKRYPPSLSDEVWRLENIRKDGPFHKRLSEKRVNTVEDFLILLSLDPTKLKTIIGSTMSPKDWEVLVQHARTCVLDKKLYSYNDSGVVFNVAGEVMGMFRDGQYVTTDKLSKAEKAHARDQLVIYAFEHRDKILTLHDETTLNPPPSSLPSSSTIQAVQIAKSKRWWDVLLSVLRWRSSIKKIRASKTCVWAIREEDDDLDALLSSFRQ
ncbi:hypothetical protein CDL12_00776 [Handroanthus impetiginosus]|uniref:Uncharacterized protein n=1 Tax=Handroanthus impetiginosus TaxID=429701 RepID=A0A2G9I9N1_9LAMI|nr:hypothetical protein CDL12_00776 [Handroanthus impetiginosus]